MNSDNIPPGVYRLIKDLKEQRDDLYIALLNITENIRHNDRDKNIDVWMKNAESILAKITPEPEIIECSV